MAFVFRRPPARWLRRKRLNGTGSAATFTLNASVTAWTISTVAATFTVTENASVTAWSISGVAATFSVSWAGNTNAAWSWAGVAASFTVAENASVTAWTIAGNPANEIILFAEGPTAWTIQTVPPISLVRTGGDYDFPLGGIGHYLEELRRAEQLAKITRKTPQPIDLRTQPRFQPFGSPPSAPAPAGVDLAGLQKQLMAGQMQAAAQAKKRRDEEALLLLAS